MNDWANPTISKIWGILQTPEWKNGEEHLGKGDINELRKLVLALNKCIQCEHNVVHAATLDRLRLRQNG